VPQAQSPVEAPTHEYKTGEKVMARWKRNFAAAHIVNVTGPTKDRTYFVKFDGYPDTASLKGVDLKPIINHSSESKKRKADDSPVTPSASTSTFGSSVISAAANINHALADQVRKEPSKVSDGPPRSAKPSKKVKATKELEKGKKNWQAFSASKGSKAKKKDSMFRTGDGVNARVGFTGSGQAMRKDAPRSKHVYQPTEGDEY